ncbi:hypothetical protein Rhe02_43230 [Rhizocola hellebori]|uniref:Uncharacterized protein n=1 Tax=Rhizocola hellebori TaxID=1392758 RepID=A0A8J3Q979_9ACTN|nr:hypothetical protein [Rhizocola hellebori]GIH06256.1 hypothetical protein Rhe02_43230 [Rhizocola hellebori]
MDGTTKTVTTVEDLVAATQDESMQHILIEGELRRVPPIALQRGVTLTGRSPSSTLAFAEGVDGVQLHGDNAVSRLGLHTEPTRRSIFLDPAASGSFHLVDLTVTGQVDLATSAGHFLVDGLHITQADIRHRRERPELSGVGAMQGAFTLWNTDPRSVVTGTIRRVSAGSEQNPIRGSGVLVAGRLEIDLLETGSIHTDGGIPDGTTDAISGGVFVVHEAHVETVRNIGPVTSLGTNDMLLDNWGRVDRWIAQAPLTSFGRSGVGFVNFGTVDELRILAPIETHGVGARGFNVYHLEGHPDASVGTAEFDSITTHGDAAIGIQIAQPIGRLTIHKGIRTHGGEGESLVKGVLTKLSAHALSVQRGGVIAELEVGGTLTSTGEGVVPLHVLGEIKSARLAGGLS